MGILVHNNQCIILRIRLNSQCINRERSCAIRLIFFSRGLCRALVAVSYTHLLAAELRACDERGEVEKIDLFASELEGYLASDDALGKSLGDGGLADTRFADEAGVVLLAAVEDLDDALDLLLAADDRVELTVARALGEVDAVGIKELVLAPLFDLLAACLLYTSRCV